jgi:carbon-monoxide dehydrogenase medium subunit
MYPSIIDNYIRPKSVDEAISALIEGGEDALFIAGGMSLMQAIKSRMASPSCLIDLQDVAELKGISSGSQGVRIGAMTRYCEIANADELLGAHEALADAAAHIGDRQVRNRGTIGGSLCWNYIAACLPAASLGVGATVELVSGSGGLRTLAVNDFLGSPMETDRADDEIMVAVTLPPPRANTGSAYEKWGLVADALPVVGVAAMVQTDTSGVCTYARIAFSGLGEGPCRSFSAEQAMIGSTVDENDKIDQAFEAAAAELEVHADMWADEAYRKLLIRELGHEVTITAFQRARDRN